MHLRRSSPTTAWSPFSSWRPSRATSVCWWPACSPTWDYCRSSGPSSPGALGNLAGDCVWFAVGHRNSERIRASKFYRAVGPRIEKLAKKLGAWQLLAARVVYGTRNASMLFWGQFRLNTFRFLLIDGLGCAIAATGFALLGYAVGSSAEVLIGRIKRIELWLLLAVVVGGVIVYIVTRLVRRRLDD